MKKHFAILLFATLALGLCVPQVFAQASGSVKGACKDAQGNPVPDAIVVWTNMDNGQKYNLKTNGKGEYFSLGITPGKYKITLFKTPDDQKANKELYHVNGFQVQLDSRYSPQSPKLLQRPTRATSGIEHLRRRRERQPPGCRRARSCVLRARPEGDGRLERLRRGDGDAGDALDLVAGRELPAGAVDVGATGVADRRRHARGAQPHALGAGDEAALTARTPDDQAPVPHRRC